MSVNDGADGVDEDEDGERRKFELDMEERSGSIYTRNGSLTRLLWRQKS